MSEQPWPRPPPPAWPLTSSPRCYSLLHSHLRLHPHRLPLGVTIQGQRSPGRVSAASQPGPQGSQSHPRSRSWPRCWLQRERERETESARRGPLPRGPGPVGPAPHLPVSESCRDDVLRWEPPRGCGDLLGVKGHRSCWDGALGGEGLQQGKRPPIRGEGVKGGIWQGEGYLRDGEQVWLARERVGSGGWPWDECG